MDEAASQLERDHVHSVYERIAPYFNDSRYKAWPKVKQFLLEQEPGSIVADVGKASCSIFNVFQRRTKTLRRARSVFFYLLQSRFLCKRPLSRFYLMVCTHTGNPFNLVLTILLGKKTLYE